MHQLETRQVSDPQLASELQSAHVRYSGAAQSERLWSLLSWILPAVAIVAFWNLMLRKRPVAA